MNPETPDGPPSSEPTGILLGDRFCARCGYNLAGRPTEREPHYGMLITRCPACAQVAAMQEYPPLGRWSARLSMLLAALWLLFLLAMALGTLGGIIGSTIGITVEAFDQYGGVIRGEYQSWLQAEAPGRSMWDQARFGEFWAERGEELLVDPRLAWGNVIDVEETAILLVPVGISIVTSVFWSIVLIGRRTIHLVLVVAGITVFVIAVMLAIRAWLLTMDPMGHDIVAWRHCYFPPVMANLAFMGVVFSIGLALGRSICRGLVRALLPPRFRGSLAVLWTASGKEAPLPSMYARRAREQATRGAAP